MGYNEKIAAIPMPDRIRALPVSSKGFPVPWFVAWVDGEPDFRVIGSGKIKEAVEKRRCWVCGEPLGRYLAMTLGPMCAVNSTISEPPSHRECACYSAIACPFLANPRMRRREAGLPADAVQPAGDGIKRNPGAVAVWMTHGYRPFRAPGGTLFTFDDPVEVLWFAEGRKASREEVIASIDSGLPLLRTTAESEGPEAIKALERAYSRALQYLPQAA